MAKEIVVRPKERSRNALDIESKNIAKKIYEQIGIQLNPETIKYSILSTKVVRKNWEEAIVSLGLSAGADPIVSEDIAELRNSISRGENIFLDNQTNIPENEAEEQSTPEVVEQSTGISSRLKKMANTNANFDETVGATVFRDPKGNLIYAHQMPTFHLVKIAEMSEANWPSTKLEENKFFNRNYLLNNDKFLAHAKSGQLKVSRFIGSKEGRLTENEQGTLIENRGLNTNQKDGVSFGESTGAEFIADVLNSYVYNYNRNSQSVPLNPYDKNGKELFYITAPVDLKVLSDASTSDFVDLPIEKMIEQNEKDIALADTEINIYGGVFDFSDDKQRAVLTGFQHQNDDLFRESFVGKVSPITGGFFTENKAFYLYSGVQSEYEMGPLTITPSFAPGYYNYGDGKDLGYPLEFKTEVQVTFDLSKSTHMGMSYNHISNASLGTKNPGANSYMFNFLKEF